MHKRYSRAARIAVIGAGLILATYALSLAAFSLFGKRQFPTDDFNLLITTPPWPGDKFWDATFGGRNHEARSVEEMSRILERKIRLNTEKYGGDSWRFRQISLVGHGGPGYLILKLGGDHFEGGDLHVFAQIAPFADSGTKIVIRACSMLEEEKGFDFIKTLARTANCPVTAWSDIGMYNGLVQLGDGYTAHPDGRVTRQ